MRFHGSSFMNRRMMIGQVALMSISMMMASCSGFVVPSHNGMNQRVAASSLRDDKMRLYGKLWEKLGIPEDIVDWTDEDIEQYDDDDEEEDQGPYWYVMNCIAGMELGLLEQSLITQAKLEAEEETQGLIQQIKVPIEKTIKSFGTTRTMIEDKVLYPGYVFLKMYLTEKTYEPMQQLPLCRSWMGTIHRKGLYTKLPSIPMALSTEEVKKFQGLEDNSDADEEELLKQYGGYLVEDMVKVLKGNFAKEDGIIRRLKDGKVMVRLYTYGSTYDEWMPVDHVRKMSDVEAMKGLTGPTTPVTSNDLNPDGNNNSRDGKEKRNNRSDSPFSQPIGGMKNTDNNQRRMRREDRVSRGETNRANDDPRTLQQEQENWKQYREEQRQQPSKDKQKESWGLQEQSSWNSKESVERAMDGDDDWTDFTSPKPTKDKQQNTEDDDFFSSLMDELSSTLEDPSSNNKPAPTSSSKYDNQQPPRQPKQEKEEDDFFSSLMDELEGELTPSSSTPPSNEKATTQKNSEDDFFATLEADLNDSLGVTPKKVETNNEDDFFASLEANLNDSLSGGGAAEITTAKSPAVDEDDFFATLEADLNSQLDAPSLSKTVENNNKDQNEDDFFASLDIDSPPEVTKPKEKKISTTSTATSNTSSDDTLGKLTVPILKEMCRERGLKVGGKKSDLIERLS